MITALILWHALRGITALSILTIVGFLFIILAVMVGPGYVQPNSMQQLSGPELSYPPAFTDPQDPTNWTKTCSNVVNEAAKRYVLPMDIFACAPWLNSTTTRP